MKIKIINEKELKVVNCKDEVLEKSILESNAMRIEGELADANFRIDIDISEREIKKTLDNRSIIYELTEDIARKLFKTQINNYLRKKEIQGKNKEEIYEIMLKKAKETGEKQFYYRYHKESKVSQSDIDLVNVYIEADGTTVEEIIHAH